MRDEIIVKGGEVSIPLLDLVFPEREVEDDVVLGIGFGVRRRCGGGVGYRDL